MEPFDYVACSGLAEPGFPASVKRAGLTSAARINSEAPPSRLIPKRVLVVASYPERQTHSSAHAPLAVANERIPAFSVSPSAQRLTRGRLRVVCRFPTRIRTGALVATIVGGLLLSGAACGGEVSPAHDHIPAVASVVVEHPRARVVDVLPDLRSASGGDARTIAKVVIGAVLPGDESPDGRRSRGRARSPGGSLALERHRRDLTGPAGEMEESP